MIRVTVELVPYGIDTPRRIGTLLIANDGTGDQATGHYVYVRSDNRDGRAEGRVPDHDREATVWELIGKCVTAIGMD